MNDGKTFNLYCDESSHLENDGKRYMLISYVSVAYPQMELYLEQIRALKKRHQFYAEIKWSKVSRSKYSFYADLVDLFFGSDMLFRAIVVPKDAMRHEAFQQDHDTFYYKMYYQLLHHKMDMRSHYNIYLDIKDTRSAKKVQKLKEILGYRYSRIRNLQNIRSGESLFLQVADFLMGALAYNKNYPGKEDRMTAKIRLIKHIEKLAGRSLDRTTPREEDKFNIFIIDLK